MILSAESVKCTPSLGWEVGVNDPNADQFMPLFSSETTCFVNKMRSGGNSQGPHALHFRKCN
jgi:hypothetical protein